MDGGRGRSVPGTPSPPDRWAVVSQHVRIVGRACTDCGSRLRARGIGGQAVTRRYRLTALSYAASAVARLRSAISVRAARAYVEPRSRLSWSHR
jgi:hypothetical protein